MTADFRSTPVALRRILGTLLLATLASACATVVGPSLRTENAKVVGLGPDGLQILVRLSAHNHNDFDIVIDKVTADVVLNRANLGTTELDATWTLPARATTMIEAALSVPFGALPSVVLGTMLEGQVPFQVTGKANIAGAPLTVEFNYTGYVDRAMLLGAATSALP